MARKERYTDKELAQFKKIIDKKLAEAKHDLKGLKSSLSHSDDHGTDDTSPSFKIMEDGSTTLSREEVAQLAARHDRQRMAT